MRIDQTALLDDAAIRAVLGRAAWLSDEGAVDDYGEVYASDATWQFGDAVRRGLEEIVDGTRGSRASGVAGPGSGVRHHVTALTVAVDGDTGEARSYFLLVKGGGGALEFPMFGRYEDTLRRTAAGWLITSRRVLAGA